MISLSFLNLHVSPVLSVAPNNISSTTKINQAPNTVTPIIVTKVSPKVDSASGVKVYNIFHPSNTSTLNTIINCVPDTTYRLPAPLELSTLPNGVNQATDPVSYYQIYGNNITEIENQIASCAPNSDSLTGILGKFASETTYTITWQYGWYANADGSCAILNPKIGIHLSMAMPFWQTDPNQTVLSSKWQTFLTNLQTHENGHAMLSQEYANSMFNDLLGYKIFDCTNIASNVNSIMNADLSRLNTANINYDAATNHGATQGAILK